MKRTLPILIFIIFLPLLIAAQGTEKTLVKSFNPGDCSALVVSVDAPVIHEVWERDMVRAQMTIRLENGSEAVLKSLIIAGRYRLELEEGEEQCLLVAPELGRPILIGSKPLAETLSIVIFAPETVPVQIRPREAAAAGTKPAL